MKFAKGLEKAYQRTTWIINRQTDGLTHEESLLQPSFRGNCMNWVLGHILNGRVKVLELFGLPLVMDKVVTDRYARESEPVNSAETAVPLAELLAAINASQEHISTALHAATKAEMAAIVDEEHQLNLADRLEFLHWHETYHVGQLELLRQLAGTDDKII